MTIQIGKLLSHLEQLKKKSKGDQASHLDNVVTQHVTDVLRDTKSLIGNIGNERSVSYVLDKNFWNDYGVHGQKKNQSKSAYCSINFKRGQVVHIDLGHFAIGREEAYMHMAIVLANFPNLLVIAPISTDRSNNLPQDIVDAIIPMSDQDYPFLDHSSYLLVHQIRVVSKNRLYKKKSQQSVIIADVKEKPIMVLLEEKIHELYAPFATKKLKDQVKEKENEIQHLQEKIDQLQSERDAEIQYLRQELSRLSEAAGTRD